MARKKKFKQYSVVVFDFEYGRKNPEAYKKHPLKLGEKVIYLGDMPNVPGHCVVAQYSGKVVPMIHPEELRLAKEEEL